MAMTRRTWINHPITGKAMSPTSHRIRSTIPIVTSIGLVLNVRVSLFIYLTTPLTFCDVNPVDKISPL